MADGYTLCPPYSQSEFGRTAKTSVDLDMLAMDHACAAENLSVQELYTDMRNLRVSRR
jgi:hypothetical protein